MAYQFPTDVDDGYVVGVEQDDGGIVYYQYNKEQNSWEILTSSGEDNRVVSTRDVITVSEPPTLPTNFKLREQEDVNRLSNQQQVNWVLAGLASEGADLDLSEYATIAYSDEEDAKVQEQINEALTIQSNIQTEQGVQNSQINALETQLKLLAQTQAVGRWTYQRNISTSIRPPVSRTFYGTDKNGPTTIVLTSWSNLALLMIDKTDIDGTTYTFSQFEEGDKIEILATDGSSACYGTVTNDPNNESYGNLVVAVERSNGGPSEGKEYLLSVYRPGSNGGEVDLDILDGRYLIKTGDTMTGNLILDTGSGLYSKEIIKSTRNTGYAFQVRPDDGDATSSIHTNGNAVFNHITNNGHINTEEGGWVGGNWGFYNATKGIRFYNEDKATHFADITRQGVNLQTLMYGDNLWTLRVQDSSNANGKTLIYADYSSGLILPEVGELNANGNVSIGGNLAFTNGGTINVSGGGTVLSNRASLDIKTAADYPVVISSGSSYKKILAFYGYDGDQDDNRGEVAYINANGKAFFNEVYANDEKLATESFVNSSGGMRWRHATHEVAADLVEGEFFVAGNGNIYLHPISYDGVDLGVGSSATSVLDIKQLGSVHRANGDSVYHITWTQITYNNGDNKYVRVSKNATHLGDSTTQGEIYRLNIPGFTY